MQQTLTAHGSLDKGSMQKVMKHTDWESVAIDAINQNILKAAIRFFFLIGLSTANENMVL